MSDNMMVNFGKHTLHIIVKNFNICMNRNFSVVSFDRYFNGIKKHIVSVKTSPQAKLDMRKKILEYCRHNEKNEKQY